MPITTKPCEYCNGTGEVAGSPCSHCEGTGRQSLRTDAHDQTEWHVKRVVDVFGIDVDNIFPSYKIVECIDATEYDGLTDAQKDGVKVLLMCGFVDLNTGKPGRTRLLSWFGAESDTVAALQALIDA